MRLFSFALIFALTPLALRADDAAKKESAKTAAIDSQTPGMPLADAAFLGLATDPIPLERASDLNLPPGTGLSVVQLFPDGPAAKAGLQAGDVLAKMDDQLLVNPAQLRVLVRLHKAGEAAVFQIVRRGKPQEIKAALGVRKMLPLPPGGEEPRMLLPREFRMNPGQGGIRVMPFENGQLPPEILGQIPPEMRAQLEHAQRQITGQAKALDLDDDKKNEKEGQAAADGAPGEIPRGGGIHFSSRSISNDGTASHSSSVVGILPL
jgi:membrane-associated protease RseP (regulator of RpoE activity)